RDASSTTAPSFDMTMDFGAEDSLPSHVVRSMTPTGLLYSHAVVDVSLGSYPICPARVRGQSERRRSGPGRGCGVADFWRFTLISDVSHILSAIEGGDLQAAEQLLPLVYEELRKLATQRLVHEVPGQTLQSSDLVHEAYLRLVGEDEQPQ